MTYLQIVIVGILVGGLWSVLGLGKQLIPAYGFHSANAALALVHFTCGPVTPLPHEQPFG